MEVPYRLRLFDSLSVSYLLVVVVYISDSISRELQKHHYRNVYNRSSVFVSQKLFINHFVRSLGYGAFFDLSYIYKLNR